MQYDHNEAEEYDDTRRRNGGNGFFGWVKEAFTRPHNEEDDRYEDDEEPATHSGVAHLPEPSRASGGSHVPLRRPAATGGASTLRLETARRSRVSVRRSVQSFEDVRRAIDGLREGTQQIVNFEQTPADMAERLIDFLNGATYSIDGAVEKIGEHVYLFTPPTVSIDVEDRSLSGAKTTPFFDRD
ncbi:MAG TPA: cell division protein SepF [Capsulimonadaceae bacterium]|jgi:FtsZ-interacting cell division protein YlmF